MEVLTIVVAMLIVQLVVCTVAISRLTRAVRELKEKRQQPEGCWRCVTPR
jgi:cytochrome c biogenesis protein ResB